MQATDTPTIVLLVEDERILRTAIADELRNAGCEVIETGSGEDAIAYACTGARVDVLFTDIQLPGPLNGWDVAEHLRGLDAGVTVIYASGNCVDRSRSVLRSLFFDKPYDAAAVVRACACRGTGSRL